MPTADPKSEKKAEIFQQSSTKNDEILQKYVIPDEGRETHLILDLQDTVEQPVE